MERIKLLRQRVYSKQYRAGEATKAELKNGKAGKR